MKNKGLSVLTAWLEQNIFDVSKLGEQHSCNIYLQILLPLFVILLIIQTFRNHLFTYG